MTNEADAPMQPAPAEAGAPGGVERRQDRDIDAAGEWADGDEWVEDIDSAYLQSKYTLVSVAAKRARQLLDGSKRRVDSMSEKPVTVALEELSQGKLIFERTNDGIK